MVQGAAEFDAKGSSHIPNEASPQTDEMYVVNPGHGA
jgi:hypothetical protein